MSVHVGPIHIHHLDFALDNEEDVASLSALLDDVVEGREGEGLGAHADKVQDVVGQAGEERQFFEQRSHMDTAVSEGAVGYCVGESRTRRLPFLVCIDDVAITQDTCLCHDHVAILAFALARDLAQGECGALASELLLLALQDGQALLGFVHDGHFDLGELGQLLLEVLLVQAHDERAHVGDDGGGAGDVHEDADLAKESTRLQFRIGALLVPRGDSHGTPHQPVHGLARLALGEDGVVRLVELRLEVQSDGREEGVGGCLEERKGAQTVEQVEWETLDGGGG